MSFADSLTKDIQQKVDEAVKAALEARIPILAEKLKIEEKELRSLLDLPIKKATTTFTSKPKEDQKEVKKLPIFPDFDDGSLYIVKDYTDKSFAVFGQTVTKEIQKQNLRCHGILNISGLLAYGKG